MQIVATNNKRIAKNTLMLYIRMLLSMVVSLYTSRVVLEVLGVEDYGIYGLVGGVVAMFSFLNSTMAGATSRFLTFEMGRGDQGRLKATFSSALIIHIGIALLVLILAESVGLWFLNNKLVIPEGRMHAAHLVLQFSVISMLINFTQVPYNAAIIAHEKMDVYAYVELLNVFLKLAIVYLLSIGNYDKLILYAFLVLVVSVLIAFIYRIYCVKHYDETKFSLYFDKQISKEIISFSLYNLLGNMGSVVNTQGTAFVINKFFGLVYNAASTVGTTVSGVITGFASNIMTAFRPQITKSYAAGELENFQSLLSWATKAVLLVYALVAIPVAISINELLALWLVEVPYYANTFCQLLLLNIFFETSRYIVIMGIHATGKVKLVSISAGISFLLNPFIVYLMFYMNMPAAFAYVSLIVINIVLTLVDIIILKHNDNRIEIGGLFMSLFRTVLAVAVTYVVSAYVYHLLAFNNIVNIVFLVLCSSLVLFALGVYVVLTKGQRIKVNNLIKSKLFARF